MITLHPIEPEYRTVPLELIEPPDAPTRQSMDDDLLYSLADSIRAIGLMSPLCVEQRGNRYVIIAGHRRFVALGMIERGSVTCAVYPEGVDHAIAMQTHENAEREKINPADECDWFWNLYERKCDSDLEKLCALVRRNESYVNSRMLLRRGDKHILEAVREKRINLTVAEELNKISDPELRYSYLHNAINHGVNKRIAREWRLQAERIIASRSNPDAATATADTPAPPPTMTAWECPCCGSSDDPYDVEWLQVHRSCVKSFLRHFFAKVKREVFGYEETT